MKTFLFYFTFWLGTLKYAAPFLFSLNDLLQIQKFKQNHIRPFVAAWNISMYVKLLMCFSIEKSVYVCVAINIFHILFIYLASVCVSYILLCVWHVSCTSLFACHLFFIYLLLFFFAPFLSWVYNLYFSMLLPPSSHHCEAVAHLQT